MWGKATLAILVSSTSMNVAKVTVRAMNHGLCPGFQASSAADCAALDCSAISSSLRHTDVAFARAHAGVWSTFATQPATLTRGPADIPGLSKWSGS